MKKMFLDLEKENQTSSEYGQEKIFKDFLRRKQRYSDHYFVSAAQLIFKDSNEIQNRLIASNVTFLNLVDTEIKTKSKQTKF